MTDREALTYIKSLYEGLTDYAVADTLEQMDSECRMSEWGLNRTRGRIRAWLENYMAYWEDHASRHIEYWSAVDCLNKQAIQWREWWVEELKTQWHYEVAVSRVKRYL